jgi:FMN-dependent NADH-azoreductase
MSLSMNRQALVKHQLLCKENQTMPTLLRVDSSAMNRDASTSRQLTDAFVQEWQRLHSDGTVISRDLSASPLPQMSAGWIAAAHTPEAARTPEQRKVLAISDELIAELQAADEYVIGVAMYNFSIPAALKLWIDQIVRAGKTFSYESGTPAGVLRQKKATFLIASGGVYEVGTPAGEMNFVEPYLRAIFAFIGVADSRFITAGGTSRLRTGLSRDTLMGPAIESIRAHLAAVQGMEAR